MNKPLKFEGPATNTVLVQFAVLFTGIKPTFLGKCGLPPSLVPGRLFLRLLGIVQDQTTDNMARTSTVALLLVLAVAAASAQDIVDNLYPKNGEVCKDYGDQWKNITLGTCEKGTKCQAYKRGGESSSMQHVHLRSSALRLGGCCARQIPGRTPASQSNRLLNSKTLSNPIIPKLQAYHTMAANPGLTAHIPH